MEWNFTAVERFHTTGGVATTEQYHYEYASVAGNWQLSSATLRRQTGAGAWANVSRAVYSYYDGTTPQGGAGDLATVTTQVWDGDWTDTGTTLYRYYVSSMGSSSSSSSSYEFVLRFRRRVARRPAQVRGLARSVRQTGG